MPARQAPWRVLRGGVERALEHLLRPPVRRAAALARLTATALVATGLAAAQGAISVSPDEVIGEVGPYVYGANYGPLGVVPIDLFDEAAASGITFLRFPGGYWGDSNDIRTSQVDQLVRIAQLLGGAGISIHTRLLNGTPEAAAALVRYANLEKGYGIGYWHVGNEPSLFPDYTVARLNREWREIALAMLAVYPEIELIGPEPHQWTGLPGSELRDADGVEWLRGFLEANGDLVDVVAVHRYPFPRSTAHPVTTVDDLRQNVDEWTHLISRMREVALEATGRDDLRFAVTEANSHWSATSGGEATNDSHFNAIWWADVLGKLIADGAYMVNYFDLQSPEGRGGWGLFGSSAPRPSYYVYQLYQRFGTELLAASSSEEHVSVYAARRSDGALTLIVTNLNDDARTVELDLGGTDYAFEEALVLDPERSAAAVPDPRSHDGASLSLPGRSATLLVLRHPTQE